MEKLKTIPYLVKAPLGVEFPCKSVLINEGEKLVIISPGNFDELTAREIKNIDSSPVMVAPNNFHNSFLAPTKELFPDSAFYGPKRAAKTSGVELKPLKELELKSVQKIKIRGNKALGETCFFHQDSKTMIATDIVFNMRHQMNFSSKIVFALAGTKNKVAFSRLVLKTVDDKKAFNESLRSLLNYPFEKLIVAHGEDVTREEFERLLESKAKF